MRTERGNVGVHIRFVWIRHSWFFDTAGSHIRTKGDGRLGKTAQPSVSSWSKDNELEAAKQEQRRVMASTRRLLAFVGATPFHCFSATVRWATSTPQALLETASTRPDITMVRQRTLLGGAPQGKEIVETALALQPAFCRARPSRPSILRATLAVTRFASCAQEVLQAAHEGYDEGRARWNADGH